LSLVKKGIVKMANDEMEGRGWVEELIYDLIKARDAAYACFLQNVNYTTVEHPLAPLATVGCSQGGDITLFINSTWVKMFTLDQRIELLKHEILHIAFGHLTSWHAALCKEYRTRHGEKIGASITAIAADLAINQHIDMTKADEFAKTIAEKWEDVVRDIPGAPVRIDPRLFAGKRIEDYGFPKNLTTEEYCVLLEKMLKDENSLTPENLRGMDGAELFEGLDNDELYHVVKKGKDGSWTARSAAGEEIKIKPEDAEKLAATGECCDAATDKLLKVVKEDVGENVFDKTRGFDAAEIKELIEQLNKPPEVAWHSVLRGLESRMKATLRRATWSKPSRRNKDHMGYRRRRKLYVWFIMDTSGSMSHKELSLVSAELNGIVSRGAVVDVIHQDAAIGARHRYKRTTGLKEFFGRGGTDFSPALLELLKTSRRDKPAMAVVYTDGAGGVEKYLAELKKAGFDAPNGERTADGVELLWLLTEDGMEIDKFKKEIAGFGRVIKVKTKKKPEKEKEDE